MQSYSLKQFTRILKNNGFILDRIKGSHHIFKNEKNNIIVVPRILNICVATRLIKENNLNVNIKKTKKVPNRTCFISYCFPFHHSIGLKFLLAMDK